MAVIIKHTKEDIANFRADVCSKCHCLNSCEGTFPNMKEHIPNCPKFFNYVLGYKSFVEEQLEYDRQHPEEAEARHQRKLEISRQIKTQRRTKGKIKD